MKDDPFPDKHPKLPIMEHYKIEWFCENGHKFGLNEFRTPTGGCPICQSPLIDVTMTTMTT